MDSSSGRRHRLPHHDRDRRCLLGVIGALIGTWGGYALRMAGARLLGRDLPVAIAESVIALLLAILCVAQLHQGILIDLKRGAV